MMALEDGRDPGMFVGREEESREKERLAKEEKCKLAQQGPKDERKETEPR